MKFFTLILYVACIAIAIPQRSYCDSLLEIYDVPKLPLTQTYIDENGKRQALGPAKTKLRVVNFWALWCAPCLEELASLNTLDGWFLDADLDVITIATGKNSVTKVSDLFANLHVEKLTEYFDPKSQLAHQAGVVSVPYSILLNAKGEEIGRVIGVLDWTSNDVVSELRALVSK